MADDEDSPPVFGPKSFPRWFLFVVAFACISPAAGDNLRGDEFNVALSLLRADNIENFLTEVEKKPEVLLQVDETDTSLVEYLIYDEARDQHSQTQAGAVVSLLDEGLLNDVTLQAKIFDRILFALRRTDKGNSTFGLNDDATPSRDRSLFVALLFEVTDQDNFDASVVAPERAIGAILQICDNRRYKDGDLGQTTSAEILKMKKLIPNTQGIFLKSYVDTHILNASCVNAIMGN